MASRRRNRSLKIALTALFVFSPAAGTADEIFEWSGFLFESNKPLVKPGEWALAKQLTKLEAAIERARKHGKRIPPGINAHVGWLSEQNGKKDQAREYYREEKRLFPESAQLMNRLIEDLDR